ncbi:EAL domain-containing protein [Lichenicola sp.]|uniref:EAL domain-containing protein n=1 Tax=Lichenicola sp. TaxID=2804529 RepID=UPI003B009425
MDQLVGRPEGETTRLRRLRALKVLDTDPEDIFDNIARIAADLCGTTVGLINFVDEERQWSKAIAGGPLPREAPRSLSICARAMQGDEVLEFEDLLAHARFKLHPLTTGDHPLRFYAGAPLTMDDGTRLGALCVLDPEPRKLKPYQLATLKRLASVVIWALKLRERTVATLLDAEDARHRLEHLYAVTPAMLQSTDQHGRFVTISDRWVAELGYQRDEIVGRRFADFVALGSDTRILQAICTDAERASLHTKLICKDGSLIDVELSSMVDRDAGGRMARVMSVIENVTARDAALAALVSSQNLLERTGAIAGVGGWQVDLATGEVTWSDHTCRLHDREPGHRLTLEEAFAYYVAEDRPVLEQAVQHCLNTGEPYDLELRLVSATGRPFWARVAGSLDVENGTKIRLAGAIQDITARKLLERNLAESRELVQVTLDSIGGAIITTDLDALVTWMNPIAERLTGWTKHDAEGRPLSEVLVILDETNRTPLKDTVECCLRLGQVVSLADNMTLVSRGGSHYSIKDSAGPIRDGSGHVLGAVVVFLDISEQQRQSREMEHRATHDALTGVANRSGFDAKLRDLLAHAQLLQSTPGGSSSHVLLYIDLDQFKVVNDSCGHAAGDVLLHQVSMMLKGCVRDGDTVARLGGDEFCVILRNCSEHDGEQIAERIRVQVDQHRFEQDSRRFRVGTSIGLVAFDGSWSSRALLMQAADAACYAAKDAGRNRVHVWAEADRSTSLRLGDMQWVARLEQALDDDQFELYAQRIESLTEAGVGVRCEVLLRLREPDGKLTLPGAFVAAAERFHMASRIDRRMAEKVFAWMEAEPDFHDGIDMISINLSGQSIADTSFHQDICAMIRAAQFDVRKICLEITETAAITRFDDAKSFIDEVRSLGVKVALDDFGAGASSFGYLKTLPVDFLKIDGQFIKEITQDGLDVVAVRCFRDVARKLHVQTIAEFIECDDQRQVLAELGIDFGQGYLLHRPEPLLLAVRSSFRASGRHPCEKGNPTMEPSRARPLPPIAAVLA